MCGHPVEDNVRLLNEAKEEITAVVALNFDNNNILGPPITTASATERVGTLTRSLLLLVWDHELC